MSDRKLPIRHPGTVAAAALAVAACGGCQHGTGPFTDELADQRQVVTPSVEGIRALEADEWVVLRDYESQTARFKSGAVTHGPLFFSSPANAGNADDAFAWKTADFRRILCESGGFLIKAILLPAEVAITPPWTVMRSDGKAERVCCGMAFDEERVRER